MFLGEYTHTIDEKGRLTIPAKFRNTLASGLVLTRGLDTCLVVYPNSGWQDLAERVAKLPMSDKRVRAYRRRVFSGAVDLTPDRQGRILVPPYLREFAQLGNEVVVAGSFDYIEIWGVGLWKEQRELIEAEESGEMWEGLDI